MALGDTSSQSDNLGGLVMDPGCPRSVCQEIWQTAVMFIFEEKPAMQYLLSPQKLKSINNEM